MWAILILTLPTQPSAVRVRVWRSLRALGCVALRDGAYLLPSDRAALFAPLADEVQLHGGTAMVLTLSPRDEAQRDLLIGLFDRSEAYGLWRDTASALLAELPALGETDARRRQRQVAEALQALQQIDYYPGAAQPQAVVVLDRLRQALDTRYASGARGEPLAQPEHGIARLARPDFQGRRWVTRARPWVDRLACAWLIRRFIDPSAQLVWLADPGGGTPALPDDLGFDYDGARFTHVGARVSFEVLLASFDLEADAALRRIADAVHCLDVGGIPVTEAPGLARVLGGLHALHADDDALLAAASGVFDALYAAPAVAGATA